jgi:hypothetical protein
MAAATLAQTMRTDVEVSRVVVARDGDSVLTEAAFKKIRRFILDQGQRQTYCNRFNNNPFFRFGHYALYLDPENTNIQCEPDRSEFNTITAHSLSPTKSGGSGYWHIRLDPSRKRLILEQYHARKAGRKLRRECAQIFQEALKRIAALQQEPAGAEDPLRIGMTVAEAIQLLGEPTKREGDRLQWYHNPLGMHVAPFVEILTRDNRVLSIRRGRR